MAGFFNADEVQVIRGDEAVARPSRSTNFEHANCNTCGLSKDCTSPRIRVAGENRLPVLFLDEYPSRSVDSTGAPFTGEFGKFLRQILKKMGYDLEDFRYAYAVRCYSGKEYEPVQKAACRKRLMAEIEKSQPQIIIPMGSLSVEVLLGPRISGRLGNHPPTITDWAGCQIPDQEMNCWICPTWSLFRVRGDAVVERQVIAHIRSALALLEKPFPKRDYLAGCFPVYDEREAMDILKQARGCSDLVSFDYETTGKKPHRPGHRIVAASVSFQDDAAYGFSFSPSLDFADLWRKFLISTRVDKIAHNKKFEYQWTKVRLGYDPVITHDSMLAAHCYANQKKTGLKFLTYINFGVLGYDETIDRYIETPKEEQKTWGDNGFNLIDQAPLSELLTYCAADSLFTRLLMKKYLAELSEDQLRGYYFLCDASDKLALAEMEGLPFDVAGSQKTETWMTKRLDRLESKVLSMEEMNLWDKEKAFRLSAPADLSYLLYKKMGLSVTQKTATGKPKSDKDTLELIDHPLVARVLEWRKWQKARDTYLRGYQREAIEGIIHPFFNLHSVDTFRSSSNSPNFQNIPKREPEVKRAIRTLLKPHPGQRLVEYDYKAVEVAVSACYNKDPNLIRYVTDPSTDMHRDTGMELFLKSKDELTKDERQIAKNKFVFPEFYGSTYESTSFDLWNAMGEETKAHLRSHKIRNLKQFTEHVREIEELFWGKRFKVYAQWREDTYDDFLRRGYVDLYTGFRCWGPLERNKVVNYPIQGSAFHCLLWTFLHVSYEMEKLQLRSRLIGQIHDAAVGSIDPDEEDVVDQLFYEWGTVRVRDHWDWIIVPLRLEKSRSAIDGNWAEMEDCGLLAEGG